MAENFKLILAPNKLKRNKVLAIHIMAAILLVVIGFITLITPFTMDIFYAGRKAEVEPFTWVNVVGIVFMVLGITVIGICIFKGKLIQKPKVNMLVRLLELSSFAGIGIFSVLHKWYVPAAYAGGTVLAILIAWFFENRATSKTEIVLDQEGLHSNGSLWQKWTDIKMVVVKYNVLSVRLYSGKMYQLILNDAPTNPIAIETFSKKHIVAPKEKTIEDDW